MFIKHVSIQKFKSFDELKYMDAFDEKINLVLGANGHGKE